MENGFGEKERIKANLRLDQLRMCAIIFNENVCNAHIPYRTLVDF